MVSSSTPDGRCRPACSVGAPLAAGSAIDLATGKTLCPRRNGPFGMPTFIPLEIGTPNNGGPVVTKTGLIFIAAATDDLIKAIDINTGQILWSDVLPAGGQATPIVYVQDGKEESGHHGPRPSDTK